MMDKELYKQELWASIRQTAVNLYYLDHFRDRQKIRYPLYRGSLGMVAVLTACVSFFDISLLTKAFSVVTGLIAAVPFFFHVIPEPSDFVTMEKLRTALSNWQNSLENFWFVEWTDKKYEKYRRMKIDHGDVEKELYAMFGKMNVKMEDKSLREADRYLNKFFTSSPEA